MGCFTISKVKSLFETVKSKIEAIYIHSSHWEKEGEKPPVCGEFSNFGVNGGKVYADLELNDQGKQYFEQGIFKGISVELSDKLDKIALLPLGVKPAVAGAEFSEFENIILEFEEIEEGGTEMTIEEILAALGDMSIEDKQKLVKAIMTGATIGMKIEVMSAIVGSLSEADTRAARALAWEFADKTDITVEEFAEKKGLEVEVKEKQPAKTEEQIREEVKAEFAAEKALEDEFTEFSAMVDKKVLPVHREAYKMAFKASQGKEELIEFEEGKDKITESAHLKGKLEAMADINFTKEFARMNVSEQKEFSEKESRLEKMKAAGEAVKKIRGGK